MNINIIGLAYSGQALDATLLRHQLEKLGHRVNVESVAPLNIFQRILLKTGLHRLRRSRFDLNIFIQQPRGWWVPLARKSVVIPNPDWIDSFELKAIGKMDVVWCKTVHALNLFIRLGYPSYLLGFTSPLTKTVQINSKKNYLGCLHVAGSSELKGTTNLIEEWKKNPQWPLLTILSQIETHAMAASGIDNINLICQKIPAEEVAVLRASNGIHIQMSETEGYGHVISESMASGAVVVTLDAEPMNELISERNGFLVKAHNIGMHYMAERFAPESSDFQRVMASIFNSPIESLAEKSSAALQDFEKNKKTFEANLRILLAKLY